MRSSTYSCVIRATLRRSRTSQAWQQANVLLHARTPSLHLGGERPFIIVEAGGTTNHRIAGKFVRRELADVLADHAARRAPGAKLFQLPDQTTLASMLRDDLKRARDAWLDEAKHDASECNTFKRSRQWGSRRTHRSGRHLSRVDAW